MGSNMLSLEILQPYKRCNELYGDVDEFSLWSIDQRGFLTECLYKIRVLRITMGQDIPHKSLGLHVEGSSMDLVHNSLLLKVK